MVLGKTITESSVTATTRRRTSDSLSQSNSLAEATPQPIEPPNPGRFIRPSRYHGDEPGHVAGPRRWLAQTT